MGEVVCNVDLEYVFVFEFGFGDLCFVVLYDVFCCLCCIGLVVFVDEVEYGEGGVVLNNLVIGCE